MSAPHVYKTEAIVLRHQKLGEADKVLRLYTPSLGKLDVVAKGVRRPNSRKSGHVEVLSRTSLLIARARTLDLVTQGEGIESFATLRTDLQRLSRALYCAELVDRFSAERIENYPLYCLLLDTLHRLAERDDLDLISCYFELHLLELNGYRPQLQSCTICHSALAPVVNYFSPAAGGVVCSACRLTEASLRPLTVNALKVMRLLQSAAFADATRVRLSPVLLAEIEEHLRLYTRYVLERDVRSFEFVQLVRHTLPDASATMHAHVENVVS
jgi:DNA repair protein RecO (recombination protein O)